MNKKKINGNLPSSFRDPSGFVFFIDGNLYRQVNHSYKSKFDTFMESGLYNILVSEGLMVSHEDVEIHAPAPEIAYKIIKPSWIPFISYPYEWSFSQLKSAALITLQIQKKALEFGMILKDASAYNIQFVDSTPIFIDTLSFDNYREGEAWVAYRQFCQHFLAPLSLMAQSDVRLGQLLRNFIDGVPLDLAAKLLPFRSKFKLSLLSHIHLHAKCQSHYSDTHIEKKLFLKKEKAAASKVSRQAMFSLIDSLETAVKKLEWKPQGTEWGDYYDDTNYSNDAKQKKAALINEFIKRVESKSVWDLGGNTGYFSRIASEKGIPTVSFDIDPAAVEKNYRNCIEKSERNLLPLVLDLTNPSPSLGWQNNERFSLIERGPADTVMALALIHHLSISNNVPLPKLAEFFCQVCNTLIIEFIPKSDSQVQRLLSSREDIFPDYTINGFEKAFNTNFKTIESQRVEGSERILYLMTTSS